MPCPSSYARALGSTQDARPQSVARVLQPLRGMGLLQTLLGPDAWQHFTRDHRGKQPFAMQRVAAEILEQCDWDHLGETLAAHAADVLVVRRGEDLAMAPPRSLADLHGLFGRDTGIVLRHAELVSDRVRAICTAIAEDVPGNQRATVIATPENTHSLAWHFDAEELFIVQLAGWKTHHLRANTVVPPPLIPSGHNLAAYPLETSPLRVVELHPGDLLYVPSGWWHMARARHTSLSISIGVLGAPVTASAPASVPLDVGRRAALRDRIRKVQARLGKARADAAAWSTMNFKTLRR